MFKFAPNLRAHPAQQTEGFWPPTENKSLGSWRQVAIIQNDPPTTLIWPFSPPSYRPGLEEDQKPKAKRAPPSPMVERKMIYAQASRRPQPWLLCVTEVNLRLVTFISTDIGTKGAVIGHIARTACGQNYINLLNHGINQDPKIYVSICWSNIRPLLHLFILPRLLSSSR